MKAKHTPGFLLCYHYHTLDNKPPLTILPRTFRGAGSTSHLRRISERDGYEAGITSF